MNKNGLQNLVPVFLFEIVFETSVEKWPKKFGPFYCTWFEFVSSEWKWPAKFGPCFSIWNCFWDKCRKMAQEIWSLLLHLFYVWNKCIKMAHKIWSTLVNGGIFETCVKAWPIKFGPHFCTCFAFKTSVQKWPATHFCICFTFETNVWKWPTNFGPHLWSWVSLWDNCRKMAQ